VGDSAVGGETNAYLGMFAAFFHGMDEWIARYAWRESSHPDCLGAAVTAPSLPHPQEH